MKLIPLLLAALPLASCVAKVGSPGSGVQVSDRSLRMPEVGEEFDFIIVDGVQWGIAQEITVLRIEGRSVLVRSVYSPRPSELWIDWEDVRLTSRFSEQPH